MARSMRAFTSMAADRGPRKNMERINEHLAADEYENVQQFISNNSW